MRSFLGYSLQGGWHGVLQACMPGPGFLCRLHPAVRPFLRTSTGLARRTVSCADSPQVFSRPSCGRRDFPAPVRCRHLQGLPRSRRFSPCLPRPEDPGRPSRILPQRRCCCVGFRCVQTVAVCFLALTRLYQTSGTCAFPCGLHGSLCPLRMIRSVLFHLLPTRNTRYGWLARPYPAGTSTLQEAPSFAWRTNARRQAPPRAAAT